MSAAGHRLSIMGASGWDYRVPYSGSVEATFTAVQEQVLAGDEYIWPFDRPAEASVPRPTSLAALKAAKEIDEFWDEGTHSILDVERVDADADDPFATIRPLDAEELDELFGTRQPSAADFDRVYHDTSLLDDVLEERWTGRSVVIYRDGRPDEVFFWGYSGD